MNEEYKYKTIKSLVDNNGNKLNASVKLNCSLRHINRLIKRYKDEGKAAFSHGNSGRKPKHTFSEKLKNEIISIYNNKYFDATFSYACELLLENEGISISPSTLSRFLYSNYITSPRTTKMKKKSLATELRSKQLNSDSNKETKELQEVINVLDDPHPRRPRRAYFGEMLQMDASLHEWFGNKKSQLHIAIDDATGIIVGGYFDNQETLKGYYNVTKQILCTYGIPAMFYTDRRTIFEYKKKASKEDSTDTFTQFSYACSQLGIDIKTTSVPQAKGRVERAFQTLQQRLPIALRLAGITEIDKANVFLKSYLKKYNAKFSMPVKNIKSVFEKQPDIKTINLTLAVIYERTVDSGHCIKFKNGYYKIMNGQGLQTYFYRGTKGLLIKTFDDKLLCSINNQIYELELVPEHEKVSKDFDLKPISKKPVKRNIPSPRHPWRNDSFLKFKSNLLSEELFIC